MKSECVSGFSDGSGGHSLRLFADGAKPADFFRKIWKSEMEKYGRAALVGLLDHPAGLVG